MNRRGFLSAIAATLAVPIIGEPEELERPRRRVFSFLWDKPLVVEPDPYARRLVSYPGMQLQQPTVAYVNPQHFDALLKELYKDTTERVTDSPLLGLLAKKPGSDAAIRTLNEIRSAALQNARTRYGGFGT